MFQVSSTAIRPLVYEKIYFWRSVTKTTHSRSLFKALDMICIKKYTSLGLHNLRIHCGEAKSIKYLRELLHNHSHVVNKRIRSQVS